MAGPVGAIALAAVVACRTDYQAVLAAVGYYRAEKGTYPRDLASLRPWFRDPVTSPYFTISLDFATPGVVEVSTPGHPASPGDANCAFAGNP